MNYLHTHDRVHLDLKSSNLLVSERWTVKVGDFGTSRVILHHRLRGTDDKGPGGVESLPGME